MLALSDSFFQSHSYIDSLNRSCLMKASLILTQDIMFDADVVEYYILHITRLHLSLCLGTETPL